MKKSYLFLSTLLIILLALSGCGKDYSKEAKKFGEDFLKKVYTFEDTNKILDFESEYFAMQNSIDNIKPLMSDDAIKNYRYNITQMPIKVASVNASNLSIEKLELKQLKNEKDNNFYYFDYIMTVKLTPLDAGKETQTVDLSGKIFILHDKNDFKIDNVVSSYPPKWYELSYPDQLRWKLKQ